MSAAVPLDVLAALGRLNAFARGASSGLRTAIYDYKVVATMAEVRAGSVSLRFVLWSGKCNRCNNGRFTHWDWTDGYSVACRDCSGTGLRKLRFSESTMRDGRVWHHPWYTGNGRGQEIARRAFPGLTHVEGWDYADADGRPIPWHDVGSWAPNQPALPLSRDELVPLLNLIEDWIEKALPASSWERRHLGQRSHRGVIGAPSHTYQIDLGRAPGGCFKCGSVDLAGHCYGRMTPLFHWSLPVCRGHGEGPGKVPFPSDPPPDALFTPELQRWRARHERVEQVT